MITNFFLPEIENMYISRQHVVSRGRGYVPHSIRCDGCDMNWPPRSCDLTLLDFFLWGFLKSQLYGNKPQTIDALKVNIRHAIDQIQLDFSPQSSEIGPFVCAPPTEAVAVICMMLCSIYNGVDGPFK